MEQDKFDAKVNLLRTGYEMTLAEITQIMGSTEWLVRMAIKRLGIEVPSHVGKNTGKKAERSKQVVSDAQLLQWYVDNQISVDKIAELSGLKSSLIRSRLKGLTDVRHTTKGMKINRSDSHPNWKNGRWKNNNGYWLVWVSTNHYRLEHRVIMEGMIGRPLLKREIVHHIDQDPSNNDPSNLKLFPGQREHKAEHARLRRLTSC